MKLKVILLSFSALITSGYGMEEDHLPQAYQSRYPYEECNEDGACYLRVTHAYYETYSEVGGTPLSKVETQSASIETRSAWATCAPDVPFNATATTFKDCYYGYDYYSYDYYGYDYYGYEECIYRHRGILNEDREINWDGVLETFAPLEGADTYIQECREWDGSWWSYDYDYYYYDRNGKKGNQDIDIVHSINPNRKRAFRSAPNKQRSKRHTRNKGKSKHKTRNGMGKRRRNTGGRNGGSRGRNGGNSRRNHRRGRGNIGRKRYGSGKGGSKQYNYEYDYYYDDDYVEYFDWLTMRRIQCIFASVDLALHNCIIKVLEENPSKK